MSLIKISDGYWWWRETSAAKWKIVKISAGHIRRFGAPPVKLPAGEFGERIELPHNLTPHYAEI